MRALHTSTCRQSLSASGVRVPMDWGLVHVVHTCPSSSGPAKCGLYVDIGRHGGANLPQAGGWQMWAEGSAFSASNRWWARQVPTSLRSPSHPHAHQPPSSFYSQQHRLLPFAGGQPSCCWNLPCLCVPGVGSAWEYLSLLGAALNR